MSNRDLPARQNDGPKPHELQALADPQPRARAGRSIGDAMVRMLDLHRRETAGLRGGEVECAFLLSLRGYERLRSEVGRDSYFQRSMGGAAVLDAEGHFMGRPFEVATSGANPEFMRAVDDDFVLVRVLNKGPAWYAFALEQGLRLAQLVVEVAGAPNPRSGVDYMGLRPMETFRYQRDDYERRLQLEDPKVIAMQTIAARIA